MDTYSLQIDLGEDFVPAFPSFTSSHTLGGHRRESLWMSGADIVKELDRCGLKISKQTLFLREQAGALHTQRISPRKVNFDLNEVKTHFNIPI